jgi:putative membrane protein
MERNTQRKEFYDWFAKSGHKWLILTLTLVLFAAFTWKPLYGKEMWMQHSATFIAILIMFWDASKHKLKLVSAWAFFIFMALHIIGARWLYTMTPYNDWMISWFSWDMNEYFGWTRNHWDRMVHFLFGFLLIFPIYDLTKTKIKSNIKSWIFAWLCIQTASMVYELFEWSLSVFLSEHDADSYNGQQGDMWDAQKDMALAMLGSTTILFSAIIYSKYCLMKNAKSS